MTNNTQVFYDDEILEKVETSKQLYVYKVTGLTIDTCYSRSELDLFNEVAAEHVPHELDMFFENLVAYCTAID